MHNPTSISVENDKPTHHTEFHLDILKLLSLHLLKVRQLSHYQYWDQLAEKAVLPLKKALIHLYLFPEDRNDRVLQLNQQNYGTFF